MKYQPPKMEDLTPEQQELYLMIQLEEDEEEKRYLSEPDLHFEADCYHRELERIVQERASNNGIKEFTVIETAIPLWDIQGNGLVSFEGEFSSVVNRLVKRGDSISTGNVHKPNAPKTPSKKAAYAVHAAILAGKSKKKFQEG